MVFFSHCGVVCCRPPWPDMGDPMCGGWENGRSVKEKLERGAIVSKPDGPNWSARSSASLWGEGNQGRLRRKGAYSVLQTALNGRPRAGANRGEDGVGNSVKGHVFTPDGPTWTAQSGGGGGGVRIG